MKKPFIGSDNLLMLEIKDENILYSSYMPFLKRGGVFYPTDRYNIYHLGKPVSLMFTLMGEKSMVPGKVVWINPQNAANGRPAGVGIQFDDFDQGKTKDRIERLIAPLLKFDRRLI
ncbi:MAG: PilZ domain-containing protein [Thiotrichaceae bacterium]|nr:PilZ domain-containing protein [Thiotrichaceae bacterium]